jgi:hypothetical protein
MDIEMEVDDDNKSSVSNATDADSESETTDEQKDFEVEKVIAKRNVDGKVFLFLVFF